MFSYNDTDNENHHKYSLLFQNEELSLQVDHIVDTVEPPPLAVHLVHLWNGHSSHKADAVNRGLH